MFSATLFALFFPALVAAHGYVNKVTIDGTVYQGNSVGTTASVQSAIRQVNSNSPVKGSSNPDLPCGPGAQNAATMANANPGSSVQVSWVGGTTGTSNWPHNTGPIMHYMAKCDGSCTSFDASTAKWFKISEQGLQPGNTTWYQSQIQSGSPAQVTIPSDLAAGSYLLRSEIIALQLAMTQGGAEFYPSCIQLSVGGSQTGQPSSSELVSFPGAYSDTDPGILTPNIYNPPITYTFPGPPVAALAAGSSGSGSGSTGGSTGSPSSPAASSPSMVPSPAGAGGNSPSAAPTASSPANVGGNPSSSATGSAPASTGGNSTCMRKRAAPGPRIVVPDKRMHRRHFRKSH